MLTVAAAATHTMRKVMASPASPFAVSEASGMGIVKAKLNSLGNSECEIRAEWNERLK